MPKELPYLPSYKNVGKLFEKIKSAKIPEALTYKVLYDTLGFKSVPDRSMISLLKNLQFLDGNGKPTAKYSSLKNDALAGKEIANAIREAYKPIFDANENAHKLSQEELKGLIAQTSGADAGTVKKISGTLRALIALGNFDSKPTEVDPKNNPDKEIENHDKETKSKIRPDFHYNIQVHLPSNGTEETYLNIFNAIRKVFE